MARTKKDNHPVTVRLEKNIYNRLNQFCEDSGQPKTVAMERALLMYMDDYYKKMSFIEETKRINESIQ